MDGISDATAKPPISHDFASKSQVPAVLLLGPRGETILTIDTRNIGGMGSMQQQQQQQDQDAQLDNDFDEAPTPPMEMLIKTK